MTTEREWILENAAEHVVVMYDVETGKPDCLAIMDGDYMAIGEIDKHYALGLAAKLIELALELPDTRHKLPTATLPPEKRLKRLAAVDNEFMERDQ